MLEQTAKLYEREDWAATAKEMRSILTGLESGGLFAKDSDAAVFSQNDPSGKAKLERGGLRTESGIALELWSGFHSDDADLKKQFQEEMGSASRHRSNPNIGKPNLFIGLMLRFDVLARMGCTELLIEEWKALYLEQLRFGPGTLSEEIQETGGCHGFNGYIGALMTTEVLGLGLPSERTRTVSIAPHPGKLRWASGRAMCSDGEITLRWVADHDAHRLQMTLLLPKGWKAEYSFPFELQGWDISINGESFAVSLHKV